MSAPPRPSGYGIAKTGDPAFAVRGIVEGFYGRPWTHAQRLDMIDFIAARGMNTYVYSPKDDPLMRHDWRRPYEGLEHTHLGELVDRCLLRGIDFVFCLSPGLSIRYSDASDVRALVAKFGQVAELGVTRFGLLLDDIPPVLQHDADVAAFDTLVDAHVHLVGAVFAEVTARGHGLMVCPTQYFGRGTEPYIATLGRGIDAAIDLFWTGRLICSPSLDVHDAEIFSAHTGHRPLYWDNYPVNDVAMTHELHIGPYRDRESGLGAVSRGVIANGMEFAESSKIAFATIADYLWSPADYDPDASWRVALADVVGDDRDLAAYAQFAENSRSSCLSLDDAHDLSRALERCAFLTETGHPEPGADLADLGDRYVAASDHLLGGMRNAALADEARPWLQSFAIGARAIVELASLANEGRLQTDAARLAPYRDALIAARRRVFGDALDMTLTDLVAPPVPRPSHSAPSHKEATP